MDASSTPTSRPRRVKGASGRPRRRSGSSGSALGSYRVVRRLLVIVSASAVFVAAFIVDTAAVVRLFWACLAGQAGQRARIIAFGVLLLLMCLAIVMLYHPTDRPAAKVRKKAARRPARADDQNERIEAGDGSPGDTTPAVKRRRKKRSGTVTARP
jgi:type VI protein secretion system component VasK